MPFVTGIAASLFTMPEIYDSSNDYNNGGYIDYRMPPDPEMNLYRLVNVFLIIIPLAI